VAKREDEGDISLVGAGARVEGKIQTEGSIRIDGQLVGEAVAKSNAAIGEGGLVEGSLSAKNITVAGKVQGDLMAGEKLTLESRSVVQGDIRAARLVIDEGAMFDGKCAMAPGTTTTPEKG
jgi:cytoskeletal protein CcmA (bactofilin family)